MADDVFTLVYDGEEIEDGEMSAATLGPALVAISELFETANGLFNGSETTVATNVKANFKEGSFEVLFHIHQALSDPNTILVPGTFLGADPLINQVLGKVIGKAQEKLADGALEGLFKLLEVLRGRKPEKIERDDSRNVSIFVVGNNNHVTVSQETAKLYENPNARLLAAKVGSPLKSKGITKLRIKRDAEEIAELEQRDFPEVADVPMLAENTSQGDGGPQQLIVEIVKPTFVEGKWSVSDGNRRFQVDMQDQAFKNRVHAREIGFYDGDFYRVEMVTIQRVKNRKLTTERKITRVLEKMTPPTQVPLVIPEKSGRVFRDDDE